MHLSHNNVHESGKNHERALKEQKIYLFLMITVKTIMILMRLPGRDNEMVIGYDDTIYDDDDENYEDEHDENENVDPNNKGGGKRPFIRGS